MTRPEELYSIGEASAMLGLSPPTIRAWERRHAVVTPRRTLAGQRRYSMDDIERLKQVKRAVGTRQVSLRLAVLEAQGELPSNEDAAAATAAARDPRPPEAGGAPLNFWRLVGDLDPRLVALIDTEGRIVDCNVALARAAGVLRFRLRGARLVDLIEPYDRAKAVAIYRGPLQERPGWELNLRSPGAIGLYSFHCAPLDDQGQLLIACIGSAMS